MDCTYRFIVSKPVAKAGQARLSVRNGQSKTVNCYRGLGVGVVDGGLVWFFSFFALLSK